MFASDDELADNLVSASKATGEKVWRMPLDKAFDKMMDLKNADMKNTGGAGRLMLGRSLPAAFHQGWHAVGASRRRRHRDGRSQERHQYELGLGLGVLLNRFVQDFHEKG